MTVLVGTVGQGIRLSPDGGDTWQRIATNQGMYQNPMVRVLANHPTRPEVVFAGAGTPTPVAMFRSSDGGRTWERRVLKH